MSSLFDFSRNIRKLTGEKKYQEALAYFKSNKKEFATSDIAGNEYLISDMLSCLRHANYYDAGFIFLKTYGINITSETKERVLTSYGWLLWSKYKAENSNLNNSEEQTYSFDEEEEENTQDNNIHHTKNELIENIEILIPLLLNINSDFSKTLISHLFSVVLKTEKNKPSPNWKLVNEFCNHFDPKQLSRNCSTIQIERKGQLKPMELASDLENWYAYKTKALLKIGGWQECLEIAKKALDELNNFHYSNDVWFSRRVALSKKKLGNTEDTIKELEAILRNKNEWFIQKELAELYFEKEDIDRAFKFSIDAINNFGPLEFKIDLLYLMGKIHQAKGDPETALKHFYLSSIIRNSNGWKIPQKLSTELQQYENTEKDKINLKNLESELKGYWKSLIQKKHIPNESRNQQGTILRVLHDNERGKDGFLKCNNKEYYFSLSVNYYLTQEIDINSEVIFEICLSTDGTKEFAKIKGMAT